MSRIRDTFIQTLQLRDEPYVMEKEPCFIGVIEEGDQISLGLIIGEHEFSSKGSSNQVREDLEYWEPLGTTNWGRTTLVGIESYGDLLMLLIQHLSSIVNWVDLPINRYTPLKEVYDARVGGVPEYKKVRNSRQVIVALNISVPEEDVSGLDVARMIQDAYIQLTEGVFYNEV